MSSNLPEPLASLIRECPLKQKADREALEAGNLAHGASVYARRGAYHGDVGRWWAVWREIQRVRGISLSHAVAELGPTERMWFASWCRKHHDTESFLLAYGEYLKNPGEIGPFARDNVPYIQALSRAQNWAAALASVDRLTANDDDLFDEELALSRILLKAGETPLAERRFAPFAERHHDDAGSWLMMALLRAARGDMAKARTAFAEAAKLGSADPDLVKEAGVAVGASEADWADLTRPWPALKFDYDASMRALRENPPMRLVPGNQKSPHFYGGSHFSMPACRGCGHPIREWFTLDLRAIPHFRGLLESWDFFPLLGCVDCSVLFGRHDYELNLFTREVRLVNVIASTKRWGTPLSNHPTFPPKPVDLKPLPDEWNADDLSENCLVGGEPDWCQEPRRLFCRTCRQQMIYVASLTSTWHLAPPIPLNDAGWNYHFACDRCKTISVIAQCT